MTAHTFWRLRFASQEGGNFNYMSIYSLDFQDSSGVSLCVGGNADASSHYASYDPARVFPGGAGDWVSNNEMPCWISYEFLAAVEPAKVIVANSNIGNNPIVMLLESSDDGVDWTSEWILTKPITWVLHTPVIYNKPSLGAISAAYWAFFVSTFVANNHLAVAEISFNDANGSRVAGFFNQLGSTWSGGYDWSDAWDINPSLILEAFDTALAQGQYSTAQYPSPVAVASLVIRNTTNGINYGAVPATGGMYASLDGLAWGLSFSLDPDTLVGGYPGGPGETVTFAVQSGRTLSQAMMGSF